MDRLYSILKNMVPEVGIEPTWARGPGDFEPSEFTNPQIPQHNFINTISMS